ncbi:hypothetical protein PG996_011376 [Apiospora saccharicola]|uniref:Ecp2 effector protein-like domain-containing protein n=1 Tax=Apiospora saccharicola TaxID=335842 RepID=A0ABR1UHU6_9PEZI
MHLISSPRLYLAVALIAQAISGLHLPLSANPFHRLYQHQAAPMVERTPCCAAQSVFQPTYKAQYTCGTSTLVNHTQTNSPLLADCQMLLQNVTGTPGYYNISHWPGDSVLSPFMTNNTCQLVVAKIGSDLSINAT